MQQKQLKDLKASGSSKKQAVRHINFSLVLTLFPAVVRQDLLAALLQH